jgi:bifunctional non-homologous end joining protein LigD
MKQAAVATFDFIEPMKALPVTEPPVGDWIYELKFDGYRALAFKAVKEVRLFSCNRTNFDNDYPQLLDSLKSLTAKEATIDGEITAVDNGGRMSFQLLQTYGKAKKPRLYTMPSICSFSVARGLRKIQAWPSERCHRPKGLE